LAGAGLLLPPRPRPQIFHLLPPTDAYRMALASLPAASFQPRGPGGALVPVLEEGAGSGGGGGGGRVTWSPIDPRPAGGGGRGGALPASRPSPRIGCPAPRQPHISSGSPTQPPPLSRPPEPPPPRPAPLPDPAAAAARFPLYFDPSLPPPLVAEIGPGDVLFLPSLWCGRRRTARGWRACATRNTLAVPQPVLGPKAWCGCSALPPRCGCWPLPALSPGTTTWSSAPTPAAATGWWPSTCGARVEGGREVEQGRPASWLMRCCCLPSEAPGQPPTPPQV
jgi:hypothetical protein